MGRTRARGALKTEEKELTDRAKVLADDPDLLLPLCSIDEKCGTCPFDKISVQLKKIQELKDDPGKLKFQSGWAWNKLARAYAGLLGIPHTDKNLYFLVADLPAGKVSYIMNARVPREKLIGVQHFDNPKWRLMAYLDIAKQGYHLYSSRDKLYCSGTSPIPPPQFVKETVSRLKYSFKTDGKEYRCVHLSDKDDLTHIRLKWHSAGITFSVCENCCNKDENIYCKLTETILSRDPRDDFDIDTKFGLRCMADCQQCALGEVRLDPVLAERYLAGSLSDRELVSTYVRDVQNSLESHGKTLFVAGGDCYGTDMEKFISALNPSEDEKAALKAVLKKVDSPILLDSPTPSKVLSMCWKEHGVTAIEAVCKDRKLAEKIYEKSKNEQPPQILREAWLARREKDVISSLPVYTRLPPVAEFADMLARAHRTGGIKECAQLIDRVDKKDIKMKSVAYAFLLALSLHDGKSWQYTKEEKDFASFLCDYAKALLDSKPDEYHDALQNLLTASGAGGEIKKKE